MTETCWAGLTTRPTPRPWRARLVWPGDTNRPDDLARSGWPINANLSGVPDDTNRPDNPDGSDWPDDLVGPSQANDLDRLGRPGSTNLMGMIGPYGPSGWFGLFVSSSLPNLVCLGFPVRLSRWVGPIHLGCRAHFQIYHELKI